MLGNHPFLPPPSDPSHLHPHSPPFKGRRDATHVPVLTKRAHSAVSAAPILLTGCQQGRRLSTACTGSAGFVSEQPPSPPAAFLPRALGFTPWYPRSRSSPQPQEARFGTLHALSVCRWDIIHGSGRTSPSIELLEVYIENICNIFCIEYISHTLLYVYLCSRINPGISCF